MLKLTVYYHLIFYLWTIFMWNQTRLLLNVPFCLRNVSFSYSLHTADTLSLFECCTVIKGRYKYRVRVLMGRMNITHCFLFYHSSFNIRFAWNSLFSHRRQGKCHWNMFGLRICRLNLESINFLAPMIDWLNINRSRAQFLCVVWKSIRIELNYL